MESVQPRFPCPCCGWVVFEEPLGSYDICPVCGWEDDLAQLRFPTTGGPNRPLVIEQAAWLDTSGGNPNGHLESDFEREPEWRPIDLTMDNIEIPEPGRDHGRTYPVDRTVYYYWRRRPPSPNPAPTSQHG